MRARDYRIFNVPHPSHQPLLLSLVVESVEMNYESTEAHTFSKTDGNNLKAGARVYAGNVTYSFLEVTVDTGLDVTERGATAVAEARGYIFQVLGVYADQTFARFFGFHVGPSVGFDLQSYVLKGKVLGAEMKARTTLVEAQDGRYYVHLGAGFTTGAKVEDGAIQMKVLGSGFSVGRWNGFSLFGNEFAIHIRDILGSK